MIKIHGGIFNWKRSISLALVIMMVVSIFYGAGGQFGLIFDQGRIPELTIRAVSSDSLGIDPQAGFILSSKEPIAEQTVISRLHLSPSFAYTLEKQAGGLAYKIIPQKILAPNTVYVLSFAGEDSTKETGSGTGMDNGNDNGKENLSWAFQTKGKFRVLSSMPRDRSTEVPVNTGIEISFSHENFHADKVKDYFRISPQVSGSFEKHKKTIVFVSKGLNPQTIYEVTLKKGLPLDGTAETLAGDYVFSFETAAAGQPASVFKFELETGLTSEFSTKEAPAFSVYYDEYSSDKSRVEPPPLHIDVYRYPDSKAFQASLQKQDEVPDWSYYTRNLYREQFDPRNKTAQYDTQFLSVDRYRHYLVFPEALKPGYYAAELKAGDTVRQIWFQVSDLAVYLTQAEESCLLWANDLQTGKPASGVRVTSESQGISAEGNPDGTVFIRKSIAGKSSRDYALVQSGSNELLVPLTVRQEDAKRNSKPEDYWKYVYLDRELYQPGDTINFWGVAAARNKQAPPAGELTLELEGSGDPYIEGVESAPILTKKIAVQNNTFSGQMKMPVLKPGYYSLNIMLNDVVLLSRGFDVQTYVKPAYKLTLTQAKKAIFAGEKLDINAQTAFFEGTPVPGLKLQYNINDYSSGNENTVTTDSKGQALISYTGAFPESNFNPYSYVTVGTHAALPEVGEINASSEVYVFPGKVGLKGEAELQGDRYSLNVQMSGVDLAAINSGSDLAEENYLKGPVAGGQIKASLFQEVWTKEENGLYYDFLSKKVEKTYNYQYSTRHISDFNLLTGPDGKANYSGKLDPNYSYYLDLSAKDEEGRQTLRRIFIYGNGSRNPKEPDYYLQGTRKVSGYQPGEKAEVAFMLNDKELVSGPQSIMYYKGQTRIEDYLVSGSARYSFTFATEHIPNVDVFAVYFDGNNYHQANSCTVPFAEETRALQVNIKPDQDEYRPGGKVKLTVEVTDKDKKPVAGAQVNLNLVDEALFSLRNQEVDFLQSLYGDFLHPYLSSWSSHYHPNNLGYAEQGGEGDSARKDFQDTVLFTTVPTDGHGRAEAEFQLPDNLTSWRVTYHAFTRDLLAGSGTKQIAVRLPFFIELSTNNTYLAGDLPIITVRSFGEKLSKDQPVSYTMKLINPQGKEKTWTAGGAAFTSVDWQLPELEAGEYRLQVSAGSRGLKDSISKEISVEKSFLSRNVTNLNMAGDGMQVQGSPVEPTTVVFSDYEKSQNLRGLYQLAWADGSRLEQKLAAREARRLLKQYFPKQESYYWEELEQDSLLNYQQADGGISILPYGESSPALSAMVAAGTSGLFDDNALKRYFYHILDGQDNQDSKDAGKYNNAADLALLGLAAFREPELLAINDYLKQKDLAPAVKINLALALLEIGDGNYAQEVYRELLSLYGEDLGSVMRINAGRDQDEIIAATTQMALLAARLDQPEKYKLYQYLVENPGKDILNTVEQIQILKYNLRDMKSAPVKFTYGLNGQQTTKSLTGSESFQLTILPGDLKTFQINKVQGRVGMLTQYNVPFRAGEKGISKDLEISRAYLVNGQKSDTFNRSDLVQVQITYKIGDTVPEGLYEIVDVLPAGLAHISRPDDYADLQYKFWDYPNEVNGQKLVFMAGKTKENKGIGKINYLARVVSSGEYNAESPVLSNIKNSTVYTSGSQDRIVLK